MVELFYEEPVFDGQYKMLATEKNKRKHDSFSSTEKNQFAGKLG